MSLFSIEMRELRSFRLKYRVENFRFLIENKNAPVSICITTSLNPSERENLRKEINKLDFKVISLQKKTLQFLFQSLEWKNVSNLLEGQVFLILNKHNNNLLTKKNIVELINLKNFSLRLFLYNNQLYRKESLKKLLYSLDTNENQVLQKFYYFLISILLNLILVLSLRKSNLNL